MSSASKCNVMRNFASKEIHSVMSDKDLNARPPSCGKFLSQKAHSYCEVKYKHDTRKFVKKSADELIAIHADYPSKSIAREIKAQEEMWQSAIDLHSTIISHDHGLPLHRQNRFIQNLYDSFYKMESKRCISKPNFIICITELLQESTKGNINRCMGMSLDALYNTFDVLGNNCFNWRRFLFYLHLVSNPTLDCRQQLLHAFSFIASHDGLDNETSAKASIDVHELATVLYPMVQADCINSVIYMLDEARSTITPSGNWKTGNHASTKITIEVFELMLAQTSISHLLGRSASRWGVFHHFPVFVSRWEEEYCNPRLLQLIRDKRIVVSITDKLQRDDYKVKRLIWLEWRTYTLYRQSLRFCLNIIATTATKKMKYQGLYAFINWSTQTVAALTIQRVNRGHWGRKCAAALWTIKQSAIVIQCLVRMYFAKKILQELSALHNRAVVTVQRIIRGALGRRLAYRRLIYLVEREHLRNMQEKSRLLMLRGIWSVTKLQSCLRRIKAARHTDELRAMRQRESDIRHAMEARREKFRKERKVYERQLEEFYRSKKDEYLRNLNIQSKVVRDQVSLRTLRRKLKNDELKNAEPDLTESIKTEEWKENWEMKIREGVEDIKQHCAHCLQQPDNRAEKKIGAQVKKRVRSRTKEVLKRADSRGIPMETKDATQIATQEILYIIGEEERERLQKQMDIAFDRREKDKEEARLRAEAKRVEEKARATAFSVSVVARACRVWLAKKELRRRCLELYEKDYDEVSHAFYYRNKATNETSWTKPKAMGSFEMPTKDEWKVLRDAHNFPYYFNPFRMDMQWNPPIEKTMCCAQVPYNWYREFPVRMGQCPNFASYKVKDKSYCMVCLDAMTTR
eukprot:scaffold87397_cov70-Cyclotella_meneghiniana.AAC.13